MQPMCSCALQTAISVAGDTIGVDLEIFPNHGAEALLLFGIGEQLVEVAVNEYDADFGQCVEAFEDLKQIVTVELQHFYHHFQSIMEF